MRDRILVIAFGVATALALVSPTSTSATPRDAEKNAPRPTITLATFNVQTPERGGPAWKPRRSRALELLRRTRADIVVLQESGSFETGGGSATFPAGWLARKAGYALAPLDWSRAADGAVFHHPSRILDLQILYRASRFSIDTSNEAIVGGGNRFSHIVFRDRRSGYAFTVVDTHLNTGRGRTADEVRAKHMGDQLLRMRRWERQFGFRFPPTYVLGDLNTDRRTKRSTVTRTLRSSGLVDSLRSARKRTQTTVDTFHGRRRQVARHGRRIDQIWVPRGTTVTRWRQVVDVEDGRYVGRFASDHNPVVTTIRPPVR